MPKPRAKAATDPTPPTAPAAEPEKPKPNGHAEESESEQLTFFEQMATYSEAQWEGMKAYLYRTWPAIDLGDGKHYIGRFNRCFDESDVLDSYGSGRYHVKLNDTRAKKSIGTHSFSVYDPERAPKVDPAQVVKGDPANDSYFATWGRKTAQQSAAAVQGATDDTTAATAVHELASLAKQAMHPPASKPVDEALIGLWKETATQRDELAKELSAQNRAPQAAASQPDTLSVIERVVTLSEKLRPQQPTQQPQKSPVEQVKEMAETVTLMREAFGSPGGSSSVGSEAVNYWKIFWDSISPALTQLANPIGQALAAQMMKPAGPQNLNPPAPANTLTTTPPPANTVPATTTQTPQPAAANTTNSNPPAAADPQAAMIRGFVEQLAPFLLNAISVGADGYAFANGISTLHGPMVYDRIAAFGVDAIMSALRTHEQLWAQIGPIESRVQRFVEQFVEWGVTANEEEEEDDQTQDDPSPAPAAPAEAPRRVARSS